MAKRTTDTVPPYKTYMGGNRIPEPFLGKWYVWLMVVIFMVMLFSPIFKRCL